MSTADQSNLLPGSRLPNETIDAWARRVWSMGWVPACAGSEVWTMYPDGVERLYVVDLREAATGWLDRSDVVSPTLPTFI